MNEEIKGCFAKSLAGHDKDTVYVILDVDSEYVYLADGRIRTVDRPKRKKLKHVQIIKIKDSVIESGHKDLKNEDIKRAIKTYSCRN